MVNARVHWYFRRPTQDLRLLTGGTGGCHPRLVRVLKSGIEPSPAAARRRPTLVSSGDVDSSREPTADRRFRLLLAVAERLAMSFDRTELYQVVAEAARDLSGADFAVLRLERGGALEPVSTAGLDDEAVRRLTPIKVSDRARERDLRLGRPFVADDVRKVRTWQVHPGTPPLRGHVVIPLLDDDRFVGTLAVSTTDPRSWSSDDVEVLTALAAHAGLAFRNADLFDRLELRAARMAVVQAASARMNSATTIDAVGRAIVEEVGAIVDYHNARVYVVEPDQSIDPIAFEGKVGAYELVDWSVLRTRVGEGFTGWVALHGIPLNVPNANDDPRGLQIEGTPVVPESMLVVPMRHDAAVVGVITLSKLGIDQFDDDDLQMLTILADQAATALESARLLSRTSSMAEELRRLLDMGQELSQTLDSKQVGAVIAQHITTALGMDAGTISSWDVAADVINSEGEYPDRGIVARHPFYRLADFPETRRVLEQQATVIVDTEDPLADPSEVAILREEGARLLIMIPLVAKGRAVGLLELQSNTLVPTDEVRLALARTMANEAAMALENARLYEAARSLADRDPLTGFFNHRYLYERMGEEVMRARRSRQPLSLLLLDVDDFKLVNDTFGHQFGDRCLVHLAEVVRATLRASDVPARYGGDEFAVILPDADVEAAGRVAERIMEDLGRQPVMSDGRGPVPISVSIGVSTLGSDVRTPAELVGAADARMYAAKIAMESMEQQTGHGEAGRQPVQVA